MTDAEVTKRIEAISPKSSDLMLLWCAGMDTEAGLQEAKHAAARMGQWTGCRVVLLRVGESLETADEARMLAAGWKRTETE